MSVPSLPYPLDERQHLQIPDPDTAQFSSHSSTSSTPFINPQQAQPLPYPPATDLPYPPHQSGPLSQDGYDENFRESVSNLQLNEGLQDIGKNLLKQGNT